MIRRLRAFTIALVLPLALVAACGDDPTGGPTAGTAGAPSATPSDDTGAVGDDETDDGAHGEDSEDSHGHGDVTPVAARPLRKGERRVTVEMAEAYTPSAPTGVGTDDYRCFLVDPGLDDDAFLTGTHVRPGTPETVHHVILFQAPPDTITRAQELDAAEEGPGWTCFGGTGLTPQARLDDAPWIGAWAPGGKESVTKPGFGVPLEKGTQIVMQVHYNLLAGDAPDVSATQLRVAPARARLTPLSTMLMPGPVELPCRPEHSDGPLCDRDAALADVKERFGQGPGATADLLHLLCGDGWKAGEWQSCTRTIGEPMTIHGVAAHMHLLGRQIRIEVNPGTDRARTLLDIPVWDFDKQGGVPIKPVQLQPWDTVKVSCQHVQWLRDKLPAFEGQPDRYVLWGDGTTDEMCLGMLQVSRP